MARNATADATDSVDLTYDATGVEESGQDGSTGHQSTVAIDTSSSGEIMGNGLCFGVNRPPIVDERERCGICKGLLYEVDPENDNTVDRGDGPVLMTAVELPECKHIWHKECLERWADTKNIPIDRACPLGCWAKSRADAPVSFLDDGGDETQVAASSAASSSALAPAEHAVRARLAAEANTLGAQQQSMGPQAVGDSLEASND